MYCYEVLLQSGDHPQRNGRQNMQSYENRSLKLTERPMSVMKGWFP